MFYFKTIVIFLVVFMMGLTAQAGGLELFKSNVHKCAKCHTIKAKGLTKTIDYGDKEEEEEEGDEDEAPDLSKLSENVKHDAGFLKAFLTKQETLIAGKHKGDRHKRRFKGADADLMAIVNMLLGK